MPRLLRKVLLGGDESFAYRGYYVRRSPFDDKYRVSKDGAHVGTYDSAEAAKASIDELVG